MRALVLATLAAVWLVTLGPQESVAYPSTADCVGCHSGFPGFGPSHAAHTAIVASCTYCHTVTGDVPATNSSGLDPENSCSGCHTKGGTAAHHVVTAASTCGCHSGDPAGMENTAPPYFGTAATALTDPCADGIDNDGDNVYDTDDSDCPGTPVQDRAWSVIKEAYGSE